MRRRTWPAPAAWPTLAPGEVHVWRISLVRTRLTHAARVELRQSLSGDERLKGETHLLESAREEILIGRGVLRNILAAYLGRSPEEIQFQYGRHGKPSLAPVSNHLDIQFNISHSADWMLCALARTNAVGVDVERVRQNVDFTGMARMLFSDLDRREFLSIQEDQRAELFYGSWVRREACVKAIGLGLHFPLAAVRGSLGAAGDADTPEIEYAGTRRMYALTDLEMEPGYRAALVVDGHVDRVRQFDWAPEMMTSFLSTFAPEATRRR